MDRIKRAKAIWSCQHAFPVVVEEKEGGKKAARCLSCGQCGPAVCGEPQEALQALKENGISRPNRRML